MSCSVRGKWLWFDSHIITCEHAGGTSRYKQVPWCRPSVCNSPRSHLRKGATLSVTAQAFLQQPWNATSESQPSLMLRSLGSVGLLLLCSGPPAASGAADEEADASFQAYAQQQSTAEPKLNCAIAIVAAIVAFNALWCGVCAVCRWPWPHQAATCGLRPCRLT